MRIKLTEQETADLKRRVMVMTAGFKSAGGDDLAFRKSLSALIGDLIKATIADNPKRGDLIAAAYVLDALRRVFVCGLPADDIDRDWTFGGTNGR